MATMWSSKAGEHGPELDILQVVATCLASGSVGAPGGRSPGATRPYLSS